MRRRYLVWRPGLIHSYYSKLPGHRWLWVARLHSAMIRGAYIEESQEE
jgi:hypothetical protein